MVEALAVREQAYQGQVKKQQARLVVPQWLPLCQTRSCQFGGHLYTQKVSLACQCMVHLRDAIV